MSTDSDPASGDSASLVVTIRSPANAATVSGTVKVIAEASSSVPVLRVTFLLDDTQIAPDDTTAPYEFSWDTTRYTNGSHKITAQAFDEAGNIGAAHVTVTVENASSGPISTDPNLKVAFIGDTGLDDNFSNVLRLIKGEGAHLVLHQGDFDYSLDADAFFGVVDTILGPDFHYLASVGNHDDSSWPTGCGDPDGCYADFLKDRLARLNITPDDWDLNDQMYSITFRGLRVVFVGQEGVAAGDTLYAPFIQNQLAADPHIWRVCSWHKNQNAMQLGGKSDEMGWKVYETCKDLGAIIATAHEHSYERTRTLTSVQEQTVDNTCSDPGMVCVSRGLPGRSFVFVSGLGGRSIRNQDRCLPTTFPYGCKGEWAKVYTSDQGANYGALFIVFNVDGDPKKARGYFKNVLGQVVDEFEIIKTD